MPDEQAQKDERHGEATGTGPEGELDDAPSTPGPERGRGEGASSVKSRGEGQFATTAVSSSRIRVPV